MSKKQLSVGDSRTVVVDPTQKYSPTTVWVGPGEHYGFQASGKWRDGWLPACNADGWSGFYSIVGVFARLVSRVPAAQMFQLCACLDQNEQRSFAIGSAREWRAPQDLESAQELFLFANDWPTAYDNNIALPPEEGGPLKVTITRLA